MSYTNQDLLKRFNQLEKMKGSLQYEINEKKYLKWENDNKPMAFSILRRLDELKRSYFVFVDKEFKLEGEGEERKPVLLDGKTMEDYNAQATALMNENCHIKRVS